MYYTVFEQGSILDYIIELETTRLEEVHKSCSEGGVGGHRLTATITCNGQITSLNQHTPHKIFHHRNLRSIL